MFVKSLTSVVKSQLCGSIMPLKNCSCQFKMFLSSKHHKAKSNNLGYACYRLFGKYIIRDAVIVIYGYEMCKSAYAEC